MIQPAAEDVVVFRMMTREFVEGFNTHDVDRIMRWYGDTYVDVNLREPVQSWQARRQYFLDIMKKGLWIHVQPDEIVIEGALAYVRGTIQVTGPEQSQRELRYLEIARRTSDGSWVMVCGMDGAVQEYVPTQ